MIALVQGANTTITSTSLTLALDWPTTHGGLEGSAYLLTSAGKVRGDKDMIFYNQPAGGDGAITASLHTGGIAFRIELARLPALIERIVICVNASEDGRTLAAFNGMSLAASGNDNAIATFAPDIGTASEAAMMVAELYKRNGQWKLRAVAQGFNGGLAPLARSFGIDVAAPPASPPTPPASPKSVTPPVPPAPPKPVSLSKITLDKAKPSVSLEKRGSYFGEITINLNWTSGKAGIFGRNKAIDLDLGCLYEMADGRKGIVQALGDTFGDFNSDPFIELSGDDRTGAVEAGETLRINGRKWSGIKRIALFAYIYDGVPNWLATDGVVLISIPDQPPVEIRLSDGQNSQSFCGVALLENIGGTIKFTRLVQYFAGHGEFDRHVGWGMKWRAARKN